MSHVLTRDECHGARFLDAARAGVVVKVVVHNRAPRLEVTDDPPRLIQGGVSFVPVPERLVVVDPEGRRLRASPGRRFFISLETFDPCHIVTELDVSKPSAASRRRRA